MQVLEKLTLEGFVKNELPGALREISEIESVLDETLEDFKLCWSHKAKCWPYSVVHDTDPSLTDSNRSHSTNAMVLFMLETLVSGRNETSPTSRLTMGLRTPLLVRASKYLRSHRDDYNTLKSSTVAMLRRSKIRQKGTKSGTFGPNDPLTLTWLLESGFQLSDDQLGRIVDDFKRVAFRNPSEWRLNSRSNDAAAHAFPLLRLAHFVGNLVSIQEDYEGRKDLKFDRCELDDALGNFSAWFEARLHQHLSYSCIPDSTFDCAELVFSLEGLLICDPHPEGIERIICRVADVLHQKQDSNPNFRPYRPFVSNKQGMALLPLTVEVFASLLRVCERLESQFNLEPPKSFERIINRYTRWLLDARQKIRVKIQEDTPGKTVTRTVSGWCSEHTHSTKVIHVWETSQVLVFLAHQARWRRKQLEQVLLNVANFTYEPCPALMKFMPLETAKSLKEAEPCKNEPIFEKLYRGFIEPRKGGKNDSLYSALFFGPPGTGKTTFAKYVAASLGRDLVMLSPSDFLVTGGERVEARAKAIFQVLEVLEDKVILFDEIDRLVLDRQAKAYSEQSDLFQFMTPSMLPKLADLRSRKRSIFFIATNFFERIDPAIKRAGRIDNCYLVQLPDKEKRKQLIELALGERRESLTTDGSQKHPRGTLGGDNTVVVPLQQSQNRVTLIENNNLKEVLRLSLFMTIKELSSTAKSAFANFGLSQNLDDAIIRLKEELERKFSNKYGTKQKDEKEKDDKFYTHLQLLGDISMSDYKNRMTKGDYNQEAKVELESLVNLIQEVYPENG